MFLHLPLFVLSPSEQFDILNLEIISYILFIILTILFLSYFCKRFKRVRSILNLNFLFIAFNDTENCWSYDDTTITPDVFLFRKHMFKCIDNENFTHLQTNCSQDPQIWEVAYHIWSTQNLDQLTLWLELNNLASIKYVGFWDILFGGLTILALVSIGTYYVIPEVFALFIDMDPNINEAMVTLADHNSQVGRSENGWFSIDIEEHNQVVYDQMMIERKHVCEQYVAHQIQLMHQQDADIQRVLLARLPTVHADMLHDHHYFFNIYHNNYAQFRNFHPNSFTYINDSVDTYDSMRLNLQRISLGQYNRVSHSFMQQLVASEAQRYHYPFPPVHLASSDYFYNNCYNRYIVDLQNLEKRGFLATPVRDPIIDNILAMFGGGIK